MPKFYVRARRLDFNRGAWTRTFHKMFEREFRAALRAFLEAAEPRVPVDTGMARGSLKKLADYVGYDLDLSNARPREAKGLRPEKSPEAGDAKAVINLKSFSFPTYSISFDTQVYHYILHEHGYVPGVAWESFRYGRAAFKKYLKDNLKAKIPKISNYLIPVELANEDY